MRTTIKKGVTVGIIRLPTDGRTLATGSTFSLEERGKPIDGFTAVYPCARAAARRLLGPLAILK
jgi:hypothetical protein